MVRIKQDGTLYTGGGDEDSERCKVRWGEKMQSGYARGKVGMQNGGQCVDERVMQNECGYMQCAVNGELEWW